MTQRATESIVVHAPPEVVYRRRRRTSSTIRLGERPQEASTSSSATHWVDPVEVEFRAAAFGRSTTYTLRYDYSARPRGSRAGTRRAAT